MINFINLRLVSRRLAAAFVCTVFILALLLPAGESGGDLFAYAQSQPEREKIGTGKEAPDEFVPGEVIVKLRENLEPSATMSALAAGYRALGLAAERELPNEMVLFTTTDTAAAVEALNADRRVEFAQPNYIYRLHNALENPNDPLWDDQWGMHAPDGPLPNHPHGVRALEAWQHTTGVSDLVVAVIDTGIDYTHEDLAANIWINPGELPANGIDDDDNGLVDDLYGYDFVNLDSDPMDDQNHGSHVAGIIAAAKNNAKGIAGAAPGVRLMAVKAFDQWGGGTTEAIVSSIDYAALNGARVVNMSFGGGFFDPAMYWSIAAYRELLFVAAAGNWAENNDIYIFSPAGFTKDWLVDLDDNPATEPEFFPAIPQIMSVAALAPDGGQLADFSNFGELSVDLAAPGDLIISAITGQRLAGFGAAVAATGSYEPNLPYRTMFWGFGAEDLSDADDVQESITRTLEGFFDITLADTDPGQGGKPILLIDDDQSGENLFNFPDVRGTYTSALSAADYHFEPHTVPLGADAPHVGAAAADNYSAIIWFTGQAWTSGRPERGWWWEGTWLPNLTPKDQANLIAYLNAGGKLFLSGRDAGWGIEYTELYWNYLKTVFANSEIDGSPGVSGIGAPYTGAAYVFQPETIRLDLLMPLDGADLVLEYQVQDEPEKYAFFSGTSMAAPFTAAGGALILSLRPHLAPELVIDLLNANVTPLDKLDGRVASGGTLNLTEALSATLMATKPVSVTVAPSPAEINIGEPIRFSAAIHPPAADQSVTWEMVSGPGEISTEGVFSSPASGEATVRARSVADFAIFGEATVIVRPAPTEVTVSPSTATVNIDELLSFTAVVEPAEADQSVTWEMVSGPGEISTEGVFSAPASGEAKVLARSVADPAIFGEATVIVRPAPTEVTVSPSTATVNIDEPLSFTAVVGPAEADQSVTWEIVDGPGEISAEGVFISSSGGESLVRARSAVNPDIFADATVNAKLSDSFALRSAISGLDGKISGSNVGTTKERGEPNHAGNWGGSSVWFEWSAPVSGTVVFSTSGSDFDTLLALYRGTRLRRLRRVAQNDDHAGTVASHVTFRARAGLRYQIAVDGFSVARNRQAATGQIDLSWRYTAIPVTGVTLNPTRLFLERGSGEQLSATILPAEAIQRSVTWFSSNPKVAMVDQEGNVTALSPGRANISVRTVDGSHRAVCRVTVFKAIEKLTIEPESAAVEIGRRMQLHAWLTFTDGTRTRVTGAALWSSSDDQLATVSDGLVHGITITDEPVTISAKIAGYKAEASVTVIPRK